MVTIVSIVCLNTLSVLAEAKNIVELSVVVGLRKVCLMLHACQDISVVPFACRLDDIYVDSSLALAPVLDAIPILEDESRSTVRFVHRDPAVALRSIFLVD